MGGRSGLDAECVYGPSCHNVGSAWSPMNEGNAPSLEVAACQVAGVRLHAALPSPPPTGGGELAAAVGVVLVLA